MKKIFNTILVPIDYEGEHQAQYHYALDFARALKAKVILYHVYGLSRAEIEGHEHLDEAGLWSLDLLKDFRTKNTPSSYSDVKVELITEPGLTVSSITHLIADESVDLVVMGTHGQYSLLEAYFGSVTMSIIDDAKVPVLVVPDSAKYTSIKKLLYTINFEFHEIKIVEKLLQISVALGASLTCLHILEDDEHIQDIEENIDILRSIYGNHRKYKDLISFEIRVGTVKDTIAYFVLDENIDLVTTLLKNPGWKLETIESTSGQLIRRIHRPILVWKGAT